MSDFPELDPSGFRDRLDDLVHAVSGSAPDQAVKQFWWDTGPELPKRWDGSAWVTGAANKAGDTFTGTVNISGAGVHPDLGDDFALEGAAPSNYPAGFTTFRDAQGSFPAGTNGIVETINPTGAANARQLNWNTSENKVYTRVATSSTGWQAWSEIGNPYAARIYLGANQGIGSGTVTKLNLDTSHFDYGESSIVDLTNNELVLPPGLWRVSGGVHFAGNSTGDERSAFIRTGSGVTRVWDQREPSASANRITLTTLIESGGSMSAWVSARQDTGGTLDIGGGNTFQTFLDAHYVGERL